MSSIAFIKSSWRERFYSFSFAVIVFMPVILLAGLFFSPTDLPTFKWCFVQHVFGINCPGCGLTRAFLCIPQGKWHTAWQYNAMALPLFVFFVSVWITEIWRFSLGQFKELPFYYRTVTPWIMMGILAWGFAFWLARLVL